MSYSDLSVIGKEEPATRKKIGPVVYRHCLEELCPDGKETVGGFD
jgi:hypothetical protein